MMDARIKRLAAEFPTLTTMEDGVERPLTRDEYDARIVEWAVNEAEHDVQAQEAASRKQLAQDVQTALTLLDGAATLAQTRTILARLIRYLIQTGQIA